jgi:hypothetical protein
VTRSHEFFFPVFESNFFSKVSASSMSQHHTSHPPMLKLGPSLEVSADQMSQNQMRLSHIPKALSASQETMHYRARAQWNREHDFDTPAKRNVSKGKS